MDFVCFSHDDARLIAAAPELLEALKPFAWLAKIVDACGYDNAEFVDDKDIAIQAADLRRAATAIAKAEGRS